MNREIQHCDRRNRIGTAIAAAIVCVACGHGSLMAAITAGSVTGPGGSGSPNFFGSTAQSSLIYSSVNYLDITLTVDSAGYYDLVQAPSQGYVWNTTGTAWNGFKIEILSSTMGAGFTPINFPPLGNPPAYDYSSTFPFPAWNSSSIVFSGATLNHLSTMSPVSAFSTNGAGTIVIRETPMIVPEPSSLLLAGCAAAVLLAGSAWKRSQLRRALP